MPMTTDERVKQMHESAVRELVDAHRKRKDEPLLLAVRYEIEDLADIHLLEVLDEFPGGDADALMITEFEPSAQLRVLGKLHLALGSPAQVEAAVLRKDPVITRVKKGKVVWKADAKRAKKLMELLGL
jgi:hypothetical protein